MHAPPRALIRVALLCLIASIGTGVVCAPADTITFEQEVTKPIGDDATVVYKFTSPARGNNASVSASFRVEDDAPISGNPGSYRLDLYQGTTLLRSAGPPSTSGEPTLLQDVDFSTGYPDAGGVVFEIRVIEVSGPTARPFRLSMSPRYSTPTLASLGSTRAVSVAAGEFEAFTLPIAASEAGEIDFFLREFQSVAGSNLLTLLDTDHVRVKGRSLGNASIGLDNSDVPGLALAESGAGSYLLIVRNTDGTVAGNYDLILGPAPSADQPAPCETLTTAPGFGSPVIVSSKTLFPEADRDCYGFELDFGVTDLSFSLDETGTTPGSNEVRVFKNGSLVTSKKAATDVNGTAQVEADSGATYNVVVNNFADGMPNYDLTLSLLGACIGSTCILHPGSAAEIRFDLEPVPAVRQIRNDAAGADLPLEAIAAFQFDKNSSGTFDMRILGQTSGGLSFLCDTPISGSQDMLIENCDLATLDGRPFAELRRTSGGGNTAIVRMGPNLRPKTVSPPAIGSSEVTDGNLEKFGDVAIYSFTVNAPGPREVGIGFDELGIGKGNNVVSICLRSELIACLTDPDFTPVDRFIGTGDGGRPAKPLAAGDYALIVDNDATGFGDFQVCVGPLNSGDPELPIRTIHLPSDLGTNTAGDGGFLGCGDTDAFNLTTAVNQPVKITVAEPQGIPGNVVVQLYRENLPNGSGVYTLIGEKSAGTTAHLEKTLEGEPIELDATRSYRIVVDNSSIGGFGFGVTISDPSA